MIERPASPTSVLPLNTLSSLTSAHAMPSDHTPSLMDCITWICGQPWVFGFTNDGYYVRRVSTTIGSLMDSGANICITSSLSLLVAAVDVPPLTFSIGQDDASPGIDDCCT
jgi:hypothetical protein